MDQNTLKLYVMYDPDTGEFTRIKQTSNRAGLGLCTSQRKDGYYRIQINQQRFYAHRLAFLYMTGSWPLYTVDHIDGDTSNNKWTNLRDVPHAKNLQNQTRPHKDSTTGYLGVTYSPKDKKYIATCVQNKVKYKLGYYIQAEAAAQAYKAFKAGDVSDIIVSRYND